MNWFKVNLLFDQGWSCGLLEAPDKDTAWTQGRDLMRSLGAFAVTVRPGP